MSLWMSGPVIYHIKDLMRENGWAHDIIIQLVGKSISAPGGELDSGAVGEPVETKPQWLCELVSLVKQKKNEMIKK